MYSVLFFLRRYILRSDHKCNLCVKSGINLLQVEKDLRFSRWIFSPQNGFMPSTVSAQPVLAIKAPSSRL